MQSEEDSAHRVHFGCSESDDDDMFAHYMVRMFLYDHELYANVT